MCQNIYGHILRQEKKEVNWMTCLGKSHFTSSLCSFKLELKEQVAKACTF